MKKPNFLYSIWAVFNNKDQRQLENLKKKVNKVLKGPYFPIHMTISAGFLGMEKELITKMKSTLNKLNRFSIEIDNYGYENAFFQSLYIKVKKNNELISQKKIIDNVFNCQTSFFSPHISLYYGHKNDSIKKKIISKLPKLKKITKINNLCIALNDEKKLRWKIIKSFLL
jgi:HD superfamily phosphohydrolase